MRVWRICFVLYALALTTGTHWPQLELPPEAPFSDKTVHLAAFGGLTILLWLTRWISRTWVLIAVVLAWAAIDESSQGLPGIHRTVSMIDFAANATGIALAAILIVVAQRVMLKNQTVQ